ncbi:hypothetical protein IAI10_13195 [Clostridium sp. 19966]|uniref:DUF5986 family protein n=1 Tax=Clostridium sp. 19966 TaxID=2768166 RepID=UPI0028DD79FA|nr:DUF5986 family protein [Clostridium sp. 19966]MDT8717622.1 hypothetical protein [Clostridium sp. 19966]
MFEGNIPDEVMTPEDIKLLIKSINDSRHQYEYWKSQQKLGYENGKHLYRWNYIFDNISKNFKKEPFKVYHVSRGALWEFAVIYNTESKILFIILKENRFDGIKNSRDNLYHYVRVLNSKNYHFQREIEQQITMFDGLQVISDETIDEDLERMISEIKDEVAGCVNILFKENVDGVYRISGNISNYELKLLKTYDWNDYISANIEEIEDTKVVDEKIPPKIELNIRQDKVKQKKRLPMDGKKKSRENDDR